MVGNSCVNNTIYAQNTATALSGSSSSGSFQSFGNNIVQTSSTSGTGLTSTSSSSTGGSPSTSQTVVVQSSSAGPVTTSSYTTNSAASVNPLTVSSSSTSGSSSYIFDISNAGVMYFLQMFGMASQIPANCQSFTPNFICVSCVAGYSLLSNGVCNQYNNVNTNINSNTNSNSGSGSTTITQTTTSSISSDPNCQVPGIGNNGCQQCYFSYYFNSTLQKCTTVNPLCQTWTNQNLCLTCYGGYSLTLNGNCVVTGSGSSTSSTSTTSTSNSGTSSNANSGSGSTTVTQTATSSISSDPNCQVPSNNGCQQCYFSYYFNSTLQKCMTVNPLCQTWTNQNLCLTCYAGYSLTLNGNCIITGSGSSTSSTSTSSVSNSGSSSNANSGSGSTTITQTTTSSISSDPNCQVPGIGNNGCQQCYFSYYFNSTLQKCTTVNPLCQTWTNQNLCLTCYGGYSLTLNGNCVVTGSGSSTSSTSTASASNSGTSSSSSSTTQQYAAVTSATDPFC
jgi:hypothetical protein